MAGEASAIQHALHADLGIVAETECNTTLAVKFVCGLGDFTALIPSPLKLVLGRLPRTIRAGNRRGTVRGSACNLGESHLSCVTILEANDYHPAMQQIRHDRQKCRLLATV